MRPKTGYHVGTNGARLGPATEVICYSVTLLPLQHARRLQDGRFCLRLPWVAPKLDLPATVEIYRPSVDPIWHPRRGAACPPAPRCSSILTRRHQLHLAEAPNSSAERIAFRYLQLDPQRLARHRGGGGGWGACASRAPFHAWARKSRYNFCQLNTYTDYYAARLDCHWRRCPSKAGYVTLHRHPWPSPRNPPLTMP